MDNNSPDLLPSVQQPQYPESRERIPAPEYSDRFGQEYIPDEKSQSQAVERGVSAPQAGRPPQPLHNDPPAQASIPAPAGTPVYVPISNDHPLVAEDVDLIEDEWVEKAKEIVERTRQDPYRQNKEITLMKADYLKKRYNKDIKVSDD